MLGERGRHRGGKGMTALQMKIWCLERDERGLANTSLRLFPPKSLVKGCIEKQQQWQSQIFHLFSWNLLPAPSPAFPFLSVSDFQNLPVTLMGKLRIVLGSISLHSSPVSKSHSFFLWIIFDSSAPFPFLLSPPFWRPSHSTAGLSQGSWNYCLWGLPWQSKKRPPKNTSLHRLTFSVDVFGLLSPIKQKLNLLIFHQRP